jgi:beta-lactamase superfamily II metal-dependent hydrolase
MSDDLVTLLFHPVGQGLFASGHLCEIATAGRSFHWVYDCGSASSGTLEATCVRRLAGALSGQSRPHLDLVVLSHFDRDHISGICTLLAAFSVNDLVIPLVPLWQRLLVAFEEDRYIAKADWDFYLHPVRAIGSIAGEGVRRIILVPPSGGEGLPPGNDNTPTVRLRPEPHGALNAGGLYTPSEREKLFPDESGIRGTPSEFEGHPGVVILRQGGRLAVRDVWEFVPYNDADASRPRTESFQTQALKMRGSLLAARSESERSSALRSLKRHYEHRYKGSRSRNLISLFLYAGDARQAPGWSVISDLWPCDWLITQTEWESNGAWLESRLDRIGVLYTGDGYLDTQDRWDRLRRYLTHSRAVRPLALQVMHHGARRNWRPGLAADIGARFAVFSSDPKHRRLKHPHALVHEDFQSVGVVAQADRERGAGLCAWLSP